MRQEQAPLWWKSSPTNQSVTGACGDDGLQRRVGVDHARDGVEAGVRDARLPDLAVVPFTFFSSQSIVS